MSPAILLGQQAGSSETTPGVGALGRCEQFPWDRHGVLKEVGQILTQAAWSWHPYLLRKSSCTAEGQEIAFVGWLQVQVSPQISNYWLRVRQPVGIVQSYCVIHGCPECGSCTEPLTSLMRHCVPTFPFCPYSSWGRDGERRGAGRGPLQVDFSTLRGIP